MTPGEAFIYGHEPYLSRFVEALESDGDCWLWGRAVNGSGYGYFCISARVIAAHVVAYEFAKGPFNSWLEIDHLCGTKRCCNPEHLIAVTHAENVIRTETKYRTVLRTAMNKKTITYRDLAALLGCRLDRVRTIVGGRVSVQESEAELLSFALDLPVDVIRSTTKQGRMRPTVCKHGHSLDDAYFYNKKRVCRTCAKRRSKNYLDTHPQAREKQRERIREWQRRQREAKAVTQ